MRPKFATLSNLFWFYDRQKLQYEIKISQIKNIGNRIPNSLKAVSGTPNFTKLF